MKRDWISLAGSYSYEKNKFVFHGGIVKTETEDFSEYGVFLTNEFFNGGKISVEVEFVDLAGYTSCELIMFRDPQTDMLVTAGLHSFGDMYRVRKCESRWETIFGVGDSKNLAKGKKYSFEVTLNGSVVTLSDGGVVVMSKVLPFPLKESNVGLWCLSRNDVIVHNFSVTKENPKAFVVMQFGDPFDKYYNDIIKVICHEHEIDVKRADENFGAGVILSDIVQDINSSKFIIADISALNANVYYEIGYAHALNKPTILLAERDTKLPFDISPFRVLFYENTIAGRANFEEGLRKHVAALVSQ